MLAINRDLLAFDPLDTWQAKCVAAAKGTTAAVLMSVLVHNYQESAPALYELIFGRRIVVPAPFLESAGYISKNGSVIAKVRQRDRSLKWQALYASEIGMRNDFRRLADQLKLNDADRVELFGAVKRWVVADRRLDPTMDPKDPDAKRLILH